MQVKTLVKTCVACPAQWEGHIEDGRMFYVRYRWGIFSVSISDSPTEDVSDAVNAKVFHTEQIGDHVDGHITESDMKGILEDCGFCFEQINPKQNLFTTLTQNENKNE